MRYLYLMDISIIIPTLNEENYIRHTVDRLLANQSGKLELELIVVDAGSQDETVNTIKERTNQLVVDSTLAGAKYKSLNTGAELANGEVLLFLDADTLLPHHFDLQIREALHKKGVVGGAFEFGFNRRGVVYRIIEWINRIRYRIDKRYFGDQGLFCSRENFERVRGYPHEPIMEAAYFCKALRGIGRLALIKSPVLTSARRFEQGNVFRVFLKDTWIWIQFTLGLNIKKYAPAYWAENQNGG
ncbi:TIGR04283 family arsenosugar biosynthesis glycosyltransferase [Reichenbachiella sp.]|uniref:TIGR04283 family arsenosugar biosynthesis glycosyltransferase n=1 Tax=Reichenbachiella sp. TaxID=2184521 RepID=UPI003B5BB74B